MRCEVLLLFLALSGNVYHVSTSFQYPLIFSFGKMKVIEMTQAERKSYEEIMDEHMSELARVMYSLGKELQCPM